MARASRTVGKKALAKLQQAAKDTIVDVKKSGLKGLPLIDASCL